MGMNHFSDTPSPLNPDPINFEIVEFVRWGAYILAEIHYPNCVNFEGKKLLVFRGLTIDEFLGLTSIDPHFFPENHLIARFRPDQWDLAETFIKGLSDN